MAWQYRLLRPAPPPCHTITYPSTLSKFQDDTAVLSHPLLTLVVVILLSYRLPEPHIYLTDTVRYWHNWLYIVQVSDADHILSAWFYKFYNLRLTSLMPFYCCMWYTTMCIWTSTLESWNLTWELWQQPTIPIFTVHTPCTNIHSLYQNSQLQATHSSLGQGVVTVLKHNSQFQCNCERPAADALRTTPSPPYSWDPHCEFHSEVLLLKECTDECHSVACTIKQQVLFG